MINCNKIKIKNGAEIFGQNTLLERHCLSPPFRAIANQPLFSCATVPPHTADLPLFTRAAVLPRHDGSAAILPDVFAVP